MPRTLKNALAVLLVTVVAAACIVGTVQVASSNVPTAAYAATSDTSGGLLVCPATGCTATSCHATSSGGHGGPPMQ